MPELGGDARHVGLATRDRSDREQSSRDDGIVRVLAHRDALMEHPDDAKLIENGVKLLISSLLAHHRLSPKQADNLSEAVANVLE